MFARVQPEINLKIAMGACVNGINLEKVIGMLQGLCGIKTMNWRNQKHMELKIRGAISELHDVRQEQNLKEHVAACRELPGNW
jgi:hypothetical protein